MNAIVAGKQEKQAGSLVFKTSKSFILNTAIDISDFITQDLFNVGYIRIISILDSVILIKISCVLDESSSRGGTNIAVPDTTGYYPPLVLYAIPSTKLVGLSNDNSYDLTKNIKSFEIGTLE